MPETKHGECKWCGKKALLYLSIGAYKNTLWTGWICQKCLDKNKPWSGLIYTENNQKEDIKYDF